MEKPTIGPWQIRFSCGSLSVSDNDEPDELSRWIRNSERTPGYASHFKWATDEDKAIVESNIADEWGDSIAAEFNLIPERIKQNLADPPDFLVNTEGKEISVQLVQLVDPVHKQRVAKGETLSAGDLFLGMQWARERPIDKINEISKKKGKSMRRDRF